MARIGRGHPAAAYVHISLTTADVQIADADSFAAVDAEAPVSAAVASADTATATEAETPPSSSLVESDSGLAAEASSIAATLSTQDTGNGTETGPSPPAALSDSDSAQGADAQLSVPATLDGSDTAAATEVATGQIEFTAASDAGTWSEASSILADPSSSDTAAATETDHVDENVERYSDDDAFGPTVEAETVSVVGLDASTATEDQTFPDAYLTDDELATGSDSETIVKPVSGGGDDAEAAEGPTEPVGVRAVAGDVAGVIESASVLAILSAPADAGAGAEAAEVPPAVLADGDAGAWGEPDPSVGVEDTSGSLTFRDDVEPGLIDVTDADVLGGAEGTPGGRVSSADAATGTEGGAVAASLSSSDSVHDIETGSSPDVSVPLSNDALTASETGTPTHATLSSSDGVTLTDQQGLSRGTPGDRTFVVPAEMRTTYVSSSVQIFTIDSEDRIKLIASDGRTFEVPAEIRVTVIPGGY